MVADMAIKTNFKTAGRICDAIGLPGTMVLCGFFGKSGQRVHVPVKSDADHILKRLLGAGDFEKLVNAFKGEFLEVPELDITPLRRAGMIYRLSNRGLATNDIAQLVGINTRSVQAIRAQLRLEGFNDLAETLQVQEITATDSEGGCHD